MSHHEIEPIRGLPEPLPDGEHILWQGEPRWTSLARRIFHTRMVAVYFGILVLWRIASMAHDGAMFADIVLSAAWLVALGAAGLLIMAVLAWLIAKTTVYTITSRRVALRFGIALPMTINLPYTAIKTAAVKVDRFGVGDIALELSARNQIAYLVLWPNVRPWRFSPVEPALRAIPDAARVAEVLSTALANSAGTAVQAPVAPAAGRNAAAPDETPPDAGAGQALAAAAQ